MRIGVIGPSSTLEAVRQVAEEDFPDLDFLYRRSAFFEQAADLAQDFQTQRAVDAILFTGYVNYAYAKRRVTPSVSWAYLPHSRTSAFRALLEGMAVFHSDLRAISADCYDPALLEQVLKSVGIRPERILCAPYHFEEPGFEQRLREFHRRCHREQAVSVCLTGMEHIMPPLREEGIPCVRIYPAREVILEQIQHLQILDISSRQDRGAMAVIAARFDFDSGETDPPLREWQKLRRHNEFRERVWEAAQRMEGAVFPDGEDCCLIVTARERMQEVFLRGGEYWKLLRFGAGSGTARVWLGIGSGHTVLEAKARSLLALRQAVPNPAGASYLMEDGSGAAAPLPDGPDSPGQRTAAFFSKRLGISAATLERIHRVLSECREPMTAEEWAGKLKITPRSVNRILARLEQEGCVTVAQRRGAGRGRPARAVQITLPDGLWEE